MAKAKKKTVKKAAKKQVKKKGAPKKAKASLPAPSPASGRGEAAAPAAPKQPAPKPPAAAGEAPLDADHQVPGGVLLGRVEDYFAHVGVLALTLQAPLSVGDMIRIKGHTTDITQKVESIQINHQPVQSASAKDAAGIRVADRARKGDAVYKI